MEKAIVTQIDSATWQFTEQLLGEKVYCYLLVGTERALIIDTAYGFTDIAGAIRSITALPLLVVNTHGHFDHITGNYCFGAAYLSEKDFELYQRHTRLASLEETLAYIAGGGLKGKAAVLALRPKLKRMLAHAIPDPVPLPECGFFELGNRKVEILETPGHTQGSISLLDTKNGWLFSGDTCGDEGMLLHFPEATSVRSFHQTIRDISKLVAEGKITRNYPSHQTSPAPLEKLAFYDRLLEKLETGCLSEEEWQAGAVNEDSITIRFYPKRVKEEIA